MVFIKGRNRQQASQNSLERICAHACTYDGLACVSAADDQKDGSVLCADRDAVLVEQHGVASGGDADAEHAEGVAVAEVVCSKGYADADYGGHDKNRYGVDLRLNGTISHPSKDSRREELQSTISKRIQY